MASRRWTAGGRALSWFVLVAVFLANPAAALPVDRWSGHIAEASARFGVPRDWIRRVIQAESGGRTTKGGRPIVSRAGAMGLMQLMPRTWQEMRRRHCLGPDPHDPRDNILAGTAYLRAMHDRFGYPGLFAAYNAGPRRYAEHLAAGRRLPAETVAYVVSVGPGPPQRSLPPRKQSPSSGIFVARVELQPRAVDAALPSPAAGSLFVRLSTAAATSQ